MTSIELEEFWSMRIVKIWVVNLVDRKQKKDTKIVRAKTKEKALITAKKNSIIFSKKKCFGNARLAHPETDLKCIKVSMDKSKLNTSNFNEKGMAFYMQGQ